MLVTVLTPIVGRGNPTLAFRSDRRGVVLHVNYVHHAEGVHDHLMTLTLISAASDTGIESYGGFRVELKSGNPVKIHAYHQPLRMYTSRNDPVAYGVHASA